MESKSARNRLGPAVLVLSGLWAAPAAAQDDPPDRPVDVGLKEEVQVQLVLIDFLVLDGRDRTVPDLTIDDFILLVDGKVTEISALDADCAIGATDEPRIATERRPATPIPSDRTRRIVLAFDYGHLGNVAETYDDVFGMLEHWVAEGYEHMVITLGEVIRIEAPFTTDLDELHWTLRRMRNDRDLYARNWSGLTEFRFFDQLKALLDILERWEGRKAVVLVSGGFLPDGFDKDPQFHEIAAMAAAARTAIYPVGGGMGPSPFLRSGGVLHRLAQQTGGRVSGGTNGVSLAYARAQRDIGCTYTIAFYDPGQRADIHRRVTIRLRDGLRGKRVVHPDFYVRRSREAKKESVQVTARMAPHIFESDRLRTEYFVLEATKPDMWRTVVGVELRPGTASWIPEPQRWKLEGLLRRLNGTVVRKFEREIDVPATDPATGVTPPTQLFHELIAPPGEYALSVVVTAPDEDDPLAAARLVSLAEAPHRGPFVLGPILGRSGARPEGPAFEPVLNSTTAQGESLEALSVLCVTGGEGPRDVPTMTRWISTEDGRDVRRFEDAPLELTSDGHVRCRRVVDSIATIDLLPGRYRIHAQAASASFTTETRATEFVVGDAKASIEEGPE